MEEKRKKSVMNRKKIDITRQDKPVYCLSVVAKEAKALKQSGKLFITCDNFPAATTSIPGLPGRRVCQWMCRNLLTGAGRSE